MNGQPLPRDHGGPVRLVCPGVVGARSVKWLERVTATPDPSTSPWQRNYYVDGRGTPLRHWPVCAVCTSYDAESKTVRGYAYAGAGRGVACVEANVQGHAPSLESLLSHSVGPLGTHPRAREDDLAETDRER